MAQTILNALVNAGDKWPNSWELAAALGLKHEEVVGALKSLAARDYLSLEQCKEGRYELTEDGKRYLAEGTPERRVFGELLARGGRVERAELETALGADFAIALQNGVKRLFSVEGTALAAIGGLSLETAPNDGVALAEYSKSAFFDGRFEELSARDELKRLQRRKLVEARTLTYYRLKRGTAFAETLAVQRADLTADDIADGSWRNAALFKAINLDARGREGATGGLHPLLQMRSAYRQVLLEMGFEEMRTDRYVESSFWNFDALFQPQQHPARDAQDTFFLQQPAAAELQSEELRAYFEAVRAVHERGLDGQGDESVGWQSEWSPAEAAKNILRTHTTAISTRYLYQLAQEYKRTGEFVPRKLFSIDRVFRNETLDATHLAEFHQVEGLIIGRNLGLAHLKGLIRQFYAKVGLTDLRFKPAYNPYTEPSMEIFCFHPLLKRNVEIANSGVFRPEMLRPMGWPADVSVVAWGLSLERPAMLELQCANVRELFGARVPLKNVKEAPITLY